VGNRETRLLYSDDRTEGKLHLSTFCTVTLGYVLSGETVNDEVHVSNN